MLFDPKSYKKCQNAEFLKFRSTFAFNKLMEKYNLYGEIEKINNVDYSVITYGTFFQIVNKLASEFHFIRNKRIIIYGSGRLATILGIAVLDTLDCVIVLAENNDVENKFGFDYTLTLDSELNFTIKAAIESKKDEIRIEIPDKQGCDLVLFTSGTTALPKGCIFNSELLIKRGYDSIKALSQTDRDSYLLSLDLFHISGLTILIRTFLSGGKILITEHGNDDTLIEDITNLNPSMISFVPTQLIDCLKKGLKVFEGHRALLLGGAALPKKYLNMAHEAGFNIYCGYGSTETVAFILLFKYSGNEDSDYLGFPIDGVNVSLVNSDESEITNAGSLSVDSKSCILGYVGNERISTFETGDICRLNSDGSFSFVGRGIEFINTGGKKVNPRKIERFLNELAIIKDSLVFGIEDEYWGEKVVALVVAEDSALENDIIAACKDNLLGHEVPKRVLIVPSFLYGSVGKLNKLDTINKYRHLLN